MCVAHRRVTNPLIPFCERWLPFLPGMRANRARHTRVYELYDDMLKQLEVGLGIRVMFRFRDALLHVVCGLRRVFLPHAHFYELYDDMLKQLEVGRAGPFPMWHVGCDGCAQLLKGAVTCNEVSVPN